MTEYLDRYPTMHEYAEGKRINPKLTDLISRADAIEAVCGTCCEDGKKYEKCTIYRRGLCADLEALEALPSAETHEIRTETHGVCLISKADAIEAVADAITEERSVMDCGLDMAIKIIKALPSADAVSREEYKETDGVVTIEKQNANEVGEIKHIVVCSPNYTRYFYNESMPIQYKGGDTE